MGNEGWLWSQCRGTRPHLELIWCTQWYFTLLRWPHGPSRLLTAILGPLWSSTKQVKGPYRFDGEYGIVLHAVEGNSTSSRGEGEVSWFFSCCSGNPGYILKLWWGWPFKTRVCSVTSVLVSNYKGHLRNLFKAWQGNRDLSRGEAGDPFEIMSWVDIDNSTSFQIEISLIYLSFWMSIFPDCYG